MKYQIVKFTNLALVSLVLFLFATDLSAQRWQPYDNATGRFSVLIPGEFEERVTYQETDIGFMTIYHHVLRSTDSSDNLVYMVTWYDFPDNVIHSDSVHLLEEFFRVTVDEAVRSVRGELLYQNTMPYQNLPGWQWRINYLQDQATIRTRVILDGNRYYAIQTVAFAQKSLNNSVNRFMDSFRLLE